MTAANPGEAGGSSAPQISWWQEVGRWFFRLTLLLVAITYAFILFTFIGGQVMESFAARSVNGLPPDDAAQVTLESTDRILNLLEVTLGVVALLLPLALGVMIYIYQQNVRAQKELAEKATSAMDAARNSESKTVEMQKRVEESQSAILSSRERIRVLARRVRAALSDIEEEWKQLNQLENTVSDALERDRIMDEQLQAALDEQARSQSRLERQSADIRTAEHHLQDLGQRVQEAMARTEQYRQDLDQLRQTLKEIQRIQPELIQFTTLSEIQSKSVLMFSGDMFKAQSAVLSLLEYTRDENPVVRRESVRSFTRVPDAGDSFKLPARTNIIDRLKQIATDKDEEPAVRLEAQRILDKFANGSVPGEHP